MRATASSDSRSTARQNDGREKQPPRGHGGHYEERPDSFPPPVLTRRFLVLSGVKARLKEVYGGHGRPLAQAAGRHARQVYRTAGWTAGQALLRPLAR
ncbi:hypothetical protein MRX96_021501 [Rhipicephalus microplus]